MNTKRKKKKGGGKKTRLSKVYSMLLFVKEKEKKNVARFVLCLHCWRLREALSLSTLRLLLGLSTEWSALAHSPPSAQGYVHLKCLAGKNPRLVNDLLDDLWDSMLVVRPPWRMSVVERNFWREGRRFPYHALHSAFLCACQRTKTHGVKAVDWKEQTTCKQRNFRSSPPHHLFVAYLLIFLGCPW